MNAIKIIILLGILQGILFVLFYGGKISKSRANAYLVAWLLSLLYLLGMTFLYIQGIIKTHKDFFYSIEFSLIVQAPLGLHYLQRILYPLEKLPSNWKLLFVPALSSTLIAGMYFLFRTPLFLFYYNYSFFSLIWNFVISFFCLRMIYRKRKDLRDWLVSFQRIWWLRFILLSYIITWIMTLIIVIAAISINNPDGFKKILHGLIAIDISITLYVLSFFAMRYPILFVEEYNDSKESKDSFNLLNENSEMDYRKIILLLEKERIYLDPELTLDSLADMTNIFPAQRISQIIRKYSSGNFNTLINGYRTEHMKNILNEKKHKDKSILEIAFEAGFNSKATYNRVFRQITGMTPGEYRKQF